MIPAHFLTEVNYQSNQRIHRLARRFKSRKHAYTKFVKKGVISYYTEKEWCLRFIVSKGAKIHRRWGASQATALHYYKDIQCLKFLFNAGGNPCITDSDEKIPLSSRYSSLVPYLDDNLYYRKVLRIKIIATGNISLQNLYGENDLRIGIGSCILFEMLIEAGANPNINLNYDDENIYSLFYICLSIRVSWAKILMEHNVDYFPQNKKEKVLLREIQRDVINTNYWEGLEKLRDIELD